MTMMIGIITSVANAQYRTGYWKFDEGSGSIAYDNESIGGISDLRLYGDAKFSPVVPPVLSGISTGSLELDGSGDYAQAMSLDLIQPDGGPWTVMLWEKADPYVNNSSPMDMGGSFRIGMYSSQIEMGVSINGGWSYATGGSVNDDEWHHLCGTYDGTTVRSYVDGVETDSFTTNAYDIDTSVFRIGRGVDWGEYFNGWIDDAAIFDVALDEDTIKDLMENGVHTFINPNGPPFASISTADALIIQDEMSPYYATVDVEGFYFDSTPWPLGDPCEIVVTWSTLKKPYPYSDEPIFQNGAHSATNTIIFCGSNPSQTYNFGTYFIEFSASEPGFEDSNDVVEFIVKPYYYTGLQNHWNFDDNLNDSAPSNPPYSTQNDVLHDAGALTTFYGDGVIGKAIHVGETDFAGNWAWLETAIGNDSSDLELRRFFTVEMYVKPQLDKATTESDQLEWQDLVGKWFTYTAGQETYFESYEFVVNYGDIGLNKADPTSTALPKATTWREANVMLGAHQFPRQLGWQHIAFVGDGNAGVTFYIDGEPAGSGTYPTKEFYNTIATLRIANTLVNANGGVGRASPYVGWIDDLIFWEYNKPESYLLDRARAIPIQGPVPADETQNVAPDVVLAWSPVKGYPDETPTYDVYFAQEGNPLVTPVVTGLIDASYDPEDGGPLLNLDTKYIWKVVANHSAGTTSSDEWSFNTYPADFLGLDGTALIAHWKFDEGMGTDAHDSAGDDDVARYVWADTGTPVLPGWIPGWIDANPATAVNLPGLPKPFGYFEVEPFNDDITPFSKLADNDYTLATWMKTMPEFVNDDPDFIGLGSSWGIGRDETGQVVEFYHGDVAGGATSGTTAIGDGYWHHVAAVYEKPTVVKDTLCSIYVDGELDATEAVNDNHFLDLDPLAELRIGRNFREAYNFTGALDDMRVYRRALSAEEIKELFDQGIVNGPPAVHAGTNLIVPFPDLTFDLVTTMQDDGAPLQTNPRLVWTVLSGPGTVTLDPCIVEMGAWPGGWDPFVKDVEQVITTHVTVSEPGFYKFRFIANDTIYQHSDEVRVWVQKAAEEFPTTVAYWRFEEDTPETDYRGGGDDPNTLVIANEVASGPALIAERNQPEEVPLVTSGTGVMHPVIPLTLESNVNALTPGAGLRTYHGNRVGESGIDLGMSAEVWDGLVFCEDGITVETYVNIDPFSSGTQELNWTIFDALDAGKGLEFRNVNDSDNPDGALDHLRFEFYVGTDTPNVYERVYIMSEIRTLRLGWMHVAFTYDMDTGVARVYQNGIPAWLTHYYDGDWIEYTPWVDHWQGEPGRTFVLDEELAVDAFEFFNCESAFDEMRISASPLMAHQLLVKGPEECAEKIAGDLDGDCDVDLFDLQIFCGLWLQCNNADPTECFK